MANHPAYTGPRTFVRAVTWAARAAASKPATVPFGRGRIYCPAEQRGMARLAYIFRDRFEPELALLSRFVRPGDRVVDIGAHYGAYTLILADLVGPNGSVIAVEPASHAAAVLERNLELNGYADRVTVYRVALGEAQGTATLQIHADPSRNRIGDPDPGAAGSETVPVRLLDDLIDGPVTFIKMDVEGAEVLAYRGARRVLEKHRPIVLFEFQPDAGRSLGLDPMELWDGLVGLGYSMQRIVGEELQPVAQAPTTSVTNFVAIPR
ncbi:FkbM family methyltransferase [Blastococcus mobilis]|nr:FkbM family methyltransferase [Blastococcus mobilis]